MAVLGEISVPEQNFGPVILAFFLFALSFGNQIVIRAQLKLAIFRQKALELAQNIFVMLLDFTPPSTCCIPKRLVM